MRFHVYYRIFLSTLGTRLLLVHVLFRTHLAKIKCFNLRAEDGLEVNVVLEVQPSALRNREAIRVHQIKTRDLARCVLKDLVLSREL